MQRRFRSHLLAIIVTLVIVMGLPRIPAILGQGLRSWYSVAWLLFAILVLFAHLQRAQLLRRRSQIAAQQARRRRRRSL